MIMKVKSYDHGVIDIPELVFKIVSSNVGEISFIHLFLTPVELVVNSLLQSEHHGLSWGYHDAASASLINMRVMQIDCDPAEPTFIGVIPYVYT